MFERRLRVLLLILCLVMLGLLLRAGQVQIVQADAWNLEAERAITAARQVDAPRGRILDIKGRELAVDVPSIDGRVDYRVLTEEPDGSWLFWEAHRRCKEKDPEYVNLPRAARGERRVQEMELIKADIAAMWVELAGVEGVTVEEIQQRRREIVQTVEARQRLVQQSRFETALAKWQAEGGRASWLRWLGFTHEEPKLEDFASETVAEQTQAHIMLRAIDNAAYIRLQKRLDELPGFSLSTGRRRTYPYGEVACHVIGHLSSVSKADREEAPFADEELRRYLPHDLVGRSGLEKLWERQLRGTRGRVERRSAGEDVTTDVETAERGQDMVTALDIELSKDIYNAFFNVRFPDNDRQDVRLPMPGAAVVIDIASGEVRSMVSFPGYDSNQFEQLYPQLVADNLNRPLMNRATQFQLEPGSTVKTVVGMAAIMEGLIGPHETIECDGYMHVGGRRVTTSHRCWTMSMFGVGHHQTNPPHPTGHLTYADALERSCNVFFETCADQLGIDRLSDWMRAFGLGRPTGIGLPEVAGLVPDGATMPHGEERAKLWFAGIGQGPVASTPIQLANMSATFARKGVWTRPTLATREADRPAGNEMLVRNLHLNPQAMEQLRQGMVAVANAPAGTGRLFRQDLVVAGKTGSAQASPLYQPVFNPDGTSKLDDAGKPVWQKVASGTKEQPNPLLPWYRGTGRDQDRLAHGWYIGFAPAENPTVAYAVFVEYGGSGGTSAGSVVQSVLDALVKHGYLTANRS